jgi:hypothetical protein
MSVAVGQAFSRLSGAGLAHFEGFLHEGSPEWRLKVGEETTLSE